MIMEIAQNISTWLQIQQRDKKSFMSFYDEMMSKNVEMEEKPKIQQNSELSKEEKEQILQEMTKTQEALRKKQPRKISITEKNPKNAAAAVKIRKNSSSSSMSFSDLREFS